MSTSKRPRDDDFTPPAPHQPLDWSGLDEVALPPSKVPRISPKSDFSTFEIGRALDMPILSGPPPQPKPKPKSKAADVEPPIQTASSSAVRQDSETPSDADGASGELIDLLDLSGVDSMSAIQARFRKIATELLHNYRIEVKSKKGTDQLELLEIEFYLYKTGCHEDPFTHASPEQAQRGRWPPSRSLEEGLPTTVTHNGYRGGTRKGLDVTLGRAPPALTSKFFPTPDPPIDEGSDIIRGGALFRSARRVSDGKVISGPSLLVDEVLRLSGAREIAELVSVNWTGDISAFPPPSAPSDSPSLSVLDTAAQLKKLSASTGVVPERLSTMYLVRAPPTHAPTCPPGLGKDALVDGKLRIFRSPRIGLDLSHPTVPCPSSDAAAALVLTNPRVVFIARPYRFFVSPYVLTSNGRGQTFLGVHDAVVARGHCKSDAELLGELVRLTGFKGPTTAKYLAELRDGVADGTLSEWTGPKGKTVTSSVTAWLRMIGTLRRLNAGSQKAKGAEGAAAGPAT
ncbi:hypothetical protein GSI_01394 [Ganoderma sinense ZZ0214-1]|uniref:Uncharacterized protein n=1 Tax=Ganoderma sinense ZZ0214-1 TaxID=1077348 RepID=A0A2G8SVB4_9APHY|nr:hypothetical protein GSI_01394 [Ganoderma sinense ZZ0214-1]